MRVNTVKRICGFGCADGERGPFVDLLWNFKVAVPRMYISLP